MARLLFLSAPEASREEPVKRAPVTAVLGVALATAVSVPLSVRDAAATSQHFCTANISPCPTGDLYGIDINAADRLSGTLSGSAILHTNLGDIDCMASTFGAQSNSDTSSSSITSLAFSGTSMTTPCTTTFFGSPTATFTVNNLPYGFTVVLSGACQGGATGCDGTFTVNNLNLSIKLSNGLICSATGSPVANFYNKGNVHSPHPQTTAIEFRNAPITMGGGLCPSSATYSAVYSLTGTNPAGTDVYLTT